MAQKKPRVSQGGGRSRYGVLRGRVVATAEERSDDASPHYQIMVMPDGVRSRIAVNTKSTDAGGGPNRSMVLYRVIGDFRHPIIETVKGFREGFTPLAPKPDAGGLDYIRGSLFDPRDMRLLPPDVPGAGNDLIDAHVGQAKDDPDAVLFAFEQTWPEEDKPDRTFKFRPNRGVHDIHVNQGNPLAGGHVGDNGVWHDGCSFLWFPKADRGAAIFLAFQSQSWHTDDHTGQPLPGETGAEAARFDDLNRRLPVNAQVHPTIEIVAVRVITTRGKPAAVLLLNTGEENVDLAGWSPATSPSECRDLDGTIGTGEGLQVELPKGFLDERGGSLTLLDHAGPKVAGTAYLSAAQARPGWNKTH